MNLPSTRALCVGYLGFCSREKLSPCSSDTQISELLSEMHTGLSSSVLNAGHYCYVYFSLFGFVAELFFVCFALCSLLSLPWAFLSFPPQHVHYGFIPAVKKSHLLSHISPRTLTMFRLRSPLRGDALRYVDRQPRIR